MNMREIMRTQIQEAAAVLSALERDLPQLEVIAGEIVTCLTSGRKILTCGNGGSAAEAQHFAEELVGRYKKERRSLPAVSLVADGTLLTCIVNDYGAEEIFARQVDGLACEGDILISLSTSGNSENVVRAVERAKARGTINVALLGRDGGKLRGLADYEIIIDASTTARIQEAHMLILHLFCEAIDAAFAD